MSPFKLVLAAALLFPLALLAMDGDWHFLNSTSDVRDMDYHNGTLYCATSGGLLCLDIGSGDTRTYTKVDGLGGTGASVIAVDHAGGKVYIGMDNRNITVFQNGTFRVHTDFSSQRTVVFSKFYVHKGTLLIATNEGLGFFNGEDGGLVQPFVTKFGDGSNPYLSQPSDIRDLFVSADDTLYLLTKYFWAKAGLNWRKPLLSSNPGLQQGLPSFWTTNGATGDFAYHTADDTTVVGYRRFAVTPAGILGLPDLHTYVDAQGAQIALNVLPDSLQRPSTVLITCPAAGASPYFTAGDSFASPLPYPNFILYNCVASDAQGRLYVGTSGRGVLRISDSTSFWHGDEQVFSDFKRLKVDSYGNLYALNVAVPSAGYQNSSASLGILKYSTANRWVYLYSSNQPGVVHPGTNDIVLDGRDRLFASYYENESEHLGLNDSNHGIFIIDNPYLDAPVTSEGQTYTPFVPSRLQARSGGITIDHCPGAIGIDNNGYFYYGATVASLGFTGAIYVYKDLSWEPGAAYGSRRLNLPDYDHAPPSGGFKRMGSIIEKAMESQTDIGFNRTACIAVDFAGNVWSVRNYAYNRVDVFGLKRATADTLIYDSAQIRYKVTDSRWLEKETLGVAECRRGVDAYLATKIVSKVKADIYGNIWVGTTSGLYYYSEGRDSLGYRNVFGMWRYFLPDIAINDYDFDSLNNVWIATDGAGLKMLHINTASYPTIDAPYGTGDISKVTYTSYGQSNGLISDKVLSVAVHRKTGKVFVGFSNGLQMFESGVRSAESIGKGYAYPIQVRGDGGVLLNTMQNGSTVNVYSLSGKLILHKVLPYYQSSYQWDTRNPASRRLIATGIYLYQFTSPGHEVRTGKFAVIR